ncbi:DNA-binding transcriptional regulator, MarR family [Nonomuraea solani]|uniref:DNA-binding transcriptional regulator, MarR family n=1 Tax=Nonomuraea solani TaxID=1144553 RepID=A0A1H6ERA3_9ACTN|nr:MarR family transcriptional regulator [Nonomuraea solani]SEG99536.1 DNA-binding transcriptional regulator, MarR family [Nonomuraea solani]
MTDTMDEQDTPAPLRVLPSRMLSLVAMHSDRLVSDGLAGADARKWHYAALVALRESGPASQAGLSRRTGIYRSDLVAVINELSERGFVERAPDPADRRRNVITITAQGRRQLDRLDELISSLQDDLLAPLTRPEREEFTGFLTRLLAHHTRREPS